MSQDDVSIHEPNSSDEIEANKVGDEKDDIVQNEDMCNDAEHAECDDEPLVYLDDDTLKLNEHIEDRIRALQKTMLSLKKQLTEEKEAWKREVEELAQLQNEHCDCDCESYCSSYSPSKANSEPDSLYIEPLRIEPTVSESVIDYEQRLSLYEKTLQQIQNEKRYPTRRHMAANIYKRRLLEVENMCNMELLRLKQSFQFLQPLQQFVTDLDIQRSDSGDASRLFSNSYTSDLFSLDGSKTFTSIYPSMECIGSKIYAELSKNKSESSTQVENLDENVENSVPNDH